MSSTDLVSSMMAWVVFGQNGTIKVNSEGQTWFLNGLNGFSHIPFSTK